MLGGAVYNHDRSIILTDSVPLTEILMTVLILQPSLTPVFGKGILLLSLVGHGVKWMQVEIIETQNCSQLGFAQILQNNSTACCILQILNKCFLCVWSVLDLS